MHLNFSTRSRFSKQSCLGHIFWTTKTLELKRLPTPKASGSTPRCLARSWSSLMDRAFQKKGLRHSLSGMPWRGYRYDECTKGFRALKRCGRVIVRAINNPGPSEWFGRRTASLFIVGTWALLLFPQRLPRSLVPRAPWPDSWEPTVRKWCDSLLSHLHLSHTVTASHAKQSANSPHLSDESALRQTQQSSAAAQAPSRSSSGRSTSAHGVACSRGRDENGKE